MDIESAKKKEVQKAKEEKDKIDNKLFFEQIQKPIPEADPNIINKRDDWWNREYEFTPSTFHQNDPRRKFANHGSYLDENRDYLMPKGIVSNLSYG